MNIKRSKDTYVHLIQLSRFQDKKQGRIWQPFASPCEHVGYFDSNEFDLRAIGIEIMYSLDAIELLYVPVWTRNQVSLNRQVAAIIKW